MLHALIVVPLSLQQAYAARLQTGRQASFGNGMLSEVYLLCRSLERIAYAQYMQQDAGRLMHSQDVHNNSKSVVQSLVC